MRLLIFIDSLSKSTTKSSSSFLFHAYARIYLFTIMRKNFCADGKAEDDKIKKKKRADLKICNHKLYDAELNYLKKPTCCNNNKKMMMLLCIIFLSLSLSLSIYIYIYIWINKVFFSHHFCLKLELIKN